MARIEPITRAEQVAALIRAVDRLGLPMPTPGMRKTLAGR